MTAWTLTKTRLAGGIWEGELTGAGAAEPAISVTHMGIPLSGVELTQDTARNIWQVRVPVPVELIGDGVQTFLMSDPDGVTLASFALLSGEALAEDIRAEVDLLRAELEMFKRAFRRQGREPVGDS